MTEETQASYFPPLEEKKGWRPQATNFTRVLTYNPDTTTGMVIPAPPLTNTLLPESPDAEVSRIMNDVSTRQAERRFIEDRDIDYELARIRAERIRLEAERRRLQAERGSFEGSMF